MFIFLHMPLFTMVNLNEDFKPAGKYTVYLLLATLAGIVLVWAACCAWMFIDSIFSIFLILGIAALAVCVIFACIWAPLYYKSVVYHLNETEMTWRRGVFFRKTGIVPYNRITNVDIVQGPVMRVFGIYHLKIETAGGGASKNSAEIQIEGVENPEPIRQLIMDFVRGQKPAAAATGTEYKPVSSAAPDMQALLEEVSAIRRLLEERK